MANPCPGSRDETAHADRGSWIGSPSMAFEVCSAGEIRPRDIIVIDDTILATVEKVSFGLYWLRTGRKDGVAIDWRQNDGNASGILFRSGRDTLGWLKPTNNGRDRIV
jgi:hypothetical protein